MTRGAPVNSRASAKVGGPCFIICGGLGKGAHSHICKGLHLGCSVLGKLSLRVHSKLSMCSSGEAVHRTMASRSFFGNCCRRSSISFVRVGGSFLLDCHLPSRTMEGFKFDVSTKKGVVGRVSGQLKTVTPRLAVPKMCGLAGGTGPVLTNGSLARGGIGDLCMATRFDCLGKLFLSLAKEGS